MGFNEKTCEKIVTGLGVMSSFALIIGLSVGLTINKDTPESTSTVATTSTTTTTTTTTSTTTTPIFEESESLIVMWSSSYKLGCEIMVVNIR